MISRAASSTARTDHVPRVDIQELLKFIKVLFHDLGVDRAVASELDEGQVG